MPDSPFYDIGSKRHVREPSGTYYAQGTPRGVVDALESARANKLRVRLWYGDPATGEAWSEENEVLGRIGRSMGPCRVPLLVNNARSSGGGAISADSVLAIASAPGAYLYRHPAFNPGAWSVKPGPDSDLPWEVWREGEEGPHARFPTEAKALRLAAFMRGERFAK